MTIRSLVLFGRPDMKPKRHSVAGQERQAYMKWQPNLEKVDFTRIFTLVYRTPLVLSHYRKMGSQPKR
jgi:hypothetical protein